MSSQFGEFGVRLAPLTVCLDGLCRIGIVFGLAVANEEKMHVASLPVKLLEHFPPAGRGAFGRREEPRRHGP